MENLIKEIVLGNLTAKSKILNFIFLTIMSLLISNTIVNSFGLYAEIPDSISYMDIYNFVFSSSFVFCLFTFTIVFLAIVIYNQDLISFLSITILPILNVTVFYMLAIVSVFEYGLITMIKKHVLINRFKFHSLNLYEILKYSKTIELGTNEIFKGKYYNNRLHIIKELCNDTSEVEENVSVNAMIFMTTFTVYTIYDLNSYLYSITYYILMAVTAFVFFTAILISAGVKRKEVFLDILLNAKDDLILETKEVMTLEVKTIPKEETTPIADPAPVVIEPEKK